MMMDNNGGGANAMMLKIVLNLTKISEALSCRKFTQKIPFFFYDTPFNLEALSCGRRRRVDFLLHWRQTLQSLGQFRHIFMRRILIGKRLIIIKGMFNSPSLRSTHHIKLPKSSYVFTLRWWSWLLVFPHIDAWKNWWCWREFWTLKGDLRTLFSLKNLQKVHQKFGRHEN